MSRLFISHSSQNDDWAIALKEWLVREGWSGANDIFLDLDPERGIAAGQRWARTLEEAATRCEAVLCLVSEAWLASKWCHDEYRLADKYGKKLFALLVDDVPLERLPGGLAAQWQVVRLRGEPAERFLTVHPYTRKQSPVHIAEVALQNLKRGLDKAGIGADTFDLQPDPQGPLGWRAVYRGLEALEPEDAAVFFGRNADVVRGIDALRGLAARKAPRLLVVLGASGAGKSSFLRAGLWPRLKRDDSQWLPLRAIRAGRGGAIEGGEGLLAALEEVHQRFGLKASRADLRKSLATPDAFIALLRALRQAAAKRAVLTQPPYPLPILCLDQGEELFAADAGPESATLLALARAAIDADEALPLVTIRSDSYGLMQSAPVLTGIDQQPLSLGPVPQGEIARIIREPAELLRRTAGPSAPLFDPAVVARLQEEIEGEADALPLLAFVLQRLMREHASVGTIGLAEVEATGGVAAAIESEAEAALVDAGFGSDRTARRDALRRLFIPRLARVDRETKATQRRIGQQAELPGDLLPLANALTARRLIVMKRAEERAVATATLEVAHEALLRRWPTLVELLAADRDALLMLDGVLNAAADWSKADTADRPDYLAHRGTRLVEALGLAERGADWAREIAPAKAYLAACEQRDADERREKEAAVERERQRLEEVAAAQARTSVLQRRTQWALAAIAILVVAALGLIYAGRRSNMAHEADNRALSGSLRATEQDLQHREASLLSQLAVVEWSRGKRDRALRYAVRGTRMDLALPKEPGSGSAASAELAAIAQDFNERLVLSGHGDDLKSARFSSDGKRIATASRDNTARIWDAGTGAQLVVVRHTDEVNSAAFSLDGSRIVTASDDMTAVIWNAQTGQKLRTFTIEQLVVSAEFSRDGTKIITTDVDNVRTWNVADGKQVSSVKAEANEPGATYTSPDGARRISISIDSSDIEISDANGGHAKVLKGHEGGLQSVTFSPDGRRFATTSEDNTPRIWDTATGDPVAVLRGHDAGGVSAEFSADGSLVVTASQDGTARIWDVGPKTAVASFQAHDMRPVVTKSDGVTVSATTGYETKSAAFSPDAKAIVTVENDGTARVWNVPGRKQVATLRSGKTSIVAAVFSADGKAVITGSDDAAVRSWEPVTGREIAASRKLEGSPSIKGISADGKRVVAVTEDGTIKIFDGAMGQERAARRLYKDPTFVVASPDGLRVVAGSENGSVTIWDTTKFDLLVFNPQANFPLVSAAFDSDGTYIVVGPEGGPVDIRQATGKAIGALQGHEGGAVAVAFSPDGRRLATGSNDNTLRIWDTRTQKEIAVLVTFKGHVNSVAFSRDGTQLVASAPNDIAGIYDVRFATMRARDLVVETCTRRLHGISRMTRDEMRLAGYPDSEPLIDV